METKSTFYRGKPGSMFPVTVCLNCVHSPYPTMNWGAKQDENLPEEPTDYQFLQSIGQKITSFPITSTHTPLTSLRAVTEIIPSESFLKSKNIAETTPPIDSQKIDDIFMGFDGPADLYLTKKEIINDRWELTPIISSDESITSKRLKVTYLKRNPYLEFANPRPITSALSAVGGVFHTKEDKVNYPYYWNDMSLGSGEIVGSGVAKWLGIDDIWGGKNRYSKGVGLQRLLTEAGGLGNKEYGGWSSALFTMLLRNDLARTADTDYYYVRGYLNTSMTAKDIIQYWLDILNDSENQVIFEDTTQRKVALYNAYRMFSELLMMQKTIDDLTLFCKLGILGNGGFLSTLIIPDRENIPGYEVEVRKEDEWEELREFITQYVDSSDYNLQDLEELRPMLITEKGEPFFQPLYKMNCSDLDYEKLLEGFQTFEKAYYTFMLKGLNWNPFKIKIPDRADDGKSINMDVFKILHSPFIINSKEWTGSIIAQHPKHNIYVTTPANKLKDSQYYDPGKVDERSYYK